MMSNQLSVKDSSNELGKLLKQVPLKSLIRHDGKRDFTGAEVVTVSSTDDLLHVIRVLFKFDIASVPVVTATEQTEERKDMVFDFWQDQAQKKPGVVMGFVDMLDILAYIVSALPADETKKEVLEEAGRNLLLKPISNAINFSKRDKIVPVSQDHSVFDALQYFAQGTHRVLLFDDTKALSGLCSQSDFVRLLHTHFAKGGLQTADIDFQQKFQHHIPVESIRPTDTLFQAIAKLSHGGLRTMAVVDSHGSLIGDFTTAAVGHAFAVDNREGQKVDKEDMLRTIFGNFYLSIQDYLSKFYPKSLKPQVGLVNITLGQACKVMVESNSKQIWIMNDAHTKVPIGVITQTDICRRVAELCQAIPPTSARG